MNYWVFADLTRPQYPPTPDVLQSALAWSFFSPQSSDSPRGFVFDRQSASQPRRLRIETTRPDRRDLNSWREALRDVGIATDSSVTDVEVAHAVASALIGVEPKKGAGITAAPLGLAAALLQDSKGAMGVSGPPNFSLLINEIYQLGRFSGNRDKVDTRSASELWFDAVVKISRSGSLLRKVDLAIFQSVVRDVACIAENSQWPPSSRQLAPGAVPQAPPVWWRSDDFDSDQTPFGWFADSWSKLCSDQWIQALPARRWVDWASCLLRQALGFCFLWEAHFFRTVGRYLVAPDDESVSATMARLRSPPLGLIAWTTTGSISALDIKPRLRELLKTGLACRAALWEWQETGVPSPRDKSLEKMLLHLDKLATKKLRSTIRDALSGSVKPGGLSNLLETVEYSLLCRRESGKSADYYGFTRNVSRRFTHVLPSPEWIVVISAMAARGPGDSCRLADVMESLQRLGLRPRIDTLVRELERAGLCASSPDGDEGILVSPAFGG